jgi:hypothetical protein
LHVNEGYLPFHSKGHPDRFPFAGINQEIAITIKRQAAPRFGSSGNIAIFGQIFGTK